MNGLMNGFKWRHADLKEYILALNFVYSLNMINLCVHVFLALCFMYHPQYDILICTHVEHVPSSAFHVLDSK